MRIKKKNIRESLDSEATEKVDQVTDDAKETIEKVASDFESVGVAEPDNIEMAGSLVSGVMDGEELDENAGLPGTLDKNGNPIPAICMESVRPSMTKRELIETVLGKKDRKIIKTLKIKDLRNE